MELNEQPTPSSKNDLQEAEKSPQPVRLDKLKFEVGQEMGFFPTEKNKNS